MTANWVVNPTAQTTGLPNELHSTPVR